MITKYENAINITVDRINHLNKQIMIKNVIITILLVSMILMCVFYQNFEKYEKKDTCEMTKAYHLVSITINENKTLVKRKRGYAYAGNNRPRCCA